MGYDKGNIIADLCLYFEDFIRNIDLKKDCKK